jgi:hypothetical protein
MAIPTWVTGQVLSATDVNNWFVPVVAYKTGDSTRASTTTVSNDADLVAPLATNAFYVLTMYLYFEGSNTASQGLKWGFAFPTGWTMRYHAIYSSASGVATVGVSYVGTDVNAAGTNGAGNNRGLTINGSVFTSSSSGNLQFQWAQNVSEASTVTLHAQSYMMLNRMG